MSNKFPLFEPHDIVIVRTPVKPITEVEQIPSDVENFLLSETDDKDFIDAIRIASPDLYQGILKWKKREVSAKDSKRIVSRLFRYWLRMRSRSTPFGTFAGLTIGDVGEITSIILDQVSAHRKSTRLDMSCLCALSFHISSLAEIREKLKFTVNNSLYKVGNKYRYVEYVLDNGYRSHFLREIDSTPHIDAIVSSAHDGNYLQNLVESLSNSGEDPAEVRLFVNELINEQILISELEPCITGSDAFKTILEKLKHIAPESELVEKLGRISNLLTNDTSDVDAPTEIRRLLKTILPDVPSKDIIQTDLYLKTIRSSVSKEIISSILLDLEKILPLAPQISSDRLEKFRARFFSRYGTREIPLFFALDSDIGIGYDDRLTDYERKRNVSSWEERFRLKLDKLQKSIESGYSSITLLEEDISKLRGGDLILPDSAYVFGSLLGTEDQLVAGEHQFVLQQFHGPSSANLLGRFCQGDESLSNHVKNFLADEERTDPDAIFAEIVHLPQSRLGNVVARPVLRNFEIPYLGNSGIDKEHQIPVSDLMVSVKDNEIFLRSKRFNKRVFPRLSTAHNFVTNNLPIYKFLCDLQYQAKANIHLWDWGPCEALPFLPRVSYRHIILRKAQWQISIEENHSLNVAQLIDEFRTRYRMPKYVQLVEGDNGLTLDLDNASCKQILIDFVKSKKKALIMEFLSLTEKCFVQDQHGNRYANEIIIPIKRSPKQNPGNTYREQANERILPEISRSFIVGSEWLYLKFYCGKQTIDMVLLEVIRPLIKELGKDGIIEKWFYVRYADEEDHLRVRFNGKADFWAKVLKKVNYAITWYIENGLISKMQIDTYDREIERYGAVDFSLTESLFWIESECALDVIFVLSEFDAAIDDRLLVCMRGIVDFLQCFDFKLEDMVTYFKQCEASLLRDQRDQKEIRKEIDGAYRSKSHLLKNYLNTENDKENGFVQFETVLQKRKTKLQPIAKTILAQLKRRGISNELNGLLASYIHMFINKLFVSSSRTHEATIYVFLTKFYTSKLLISKGK